jgi:hypothetical protein
MNRIAILAVTALLSVLIAPSASAEGTVVVSQEARPSVLSAYGGVVAWSSFDAQDRRYHLRLLVDGQVRTAAVKTRGVPFDVDVGPDRSGQAVVVYSRCRREPQALQPNGLPGWDDGRGCDLFKFDPRSGVERRLAGSSSSASEYLPTVWRERVAFARVYERRRGLRGVLSYLYVRNLRPGSESQRRPGGTRGHYDRWDIGGSVDYIGGPGPTSLDLRGRRLAFAWRYERRNPCPGTESDRLSPTSRSEIWVDDRRVRRGCIDNLYSPQLGGRRVSYLLRPETSLSASWITSPLSEGETTRLAVGPGGASAAAADGFVYAVEDDPDAPGWRVVRVSD